MTTLDDLTPLQRQELIGTWVDLNGSTQPHIYLGEFTSNTGIRHGAYLFNPTYVEEIFKVYDRLHDEWIPFCWDDWIIKGVKGEFYPCKPEIFEATYEPETTNA